MYIELSFRLLRRQLNHDRWSYIFLHWNSKKRTKINLVLDLNLIRRDQRDGTLAVRLLRFVQDNLSDWYVSIRTNRCLGKSDKKTKKAPAAGRRRVHGLGRYLQGREGRARWKHVQQSQRTKRWASSRSRAFTAQNLVHIWFETTWPTYLYICLQGGFRRSGMTPALAPRMPVRGCVTVRIIGNSRLKVRQYCQGVRILKVNCIWMININKTLESDALNHSNIYFAIRHTRWRTAATTAV